PRTGGALYTQAKGQIAVQSYGITATQTLFNGLQTAGRTRQAEGQGFSARETLRTTEQNVLLSAATAYMNLLQTAAILELQRSNVNVLEVTLRQPRDRFTAGEVTRTDVAQAESRLSGGRSQLSLAESNYVTAQAQYLQVVGVPPPSQLAAAPPVDRLSPRTLDGAIGRGRTEHPLITTAMYNVDIALQQVKIAEGALAPTRRSTPPSRRSPPPRSRSTACARKPASASAPRSTCSTRNRTSSTRGWRSSPHNAIAWSPPIRYWLQPARYRRKFLGSGSRSTIPSFTTSRCATPGAACVSPTEGRGPSCPGRSAAPSGPRS